MFFSPPHFHHLPPTVVAVSTTTQAENGRQSMGGHFRLQPQPFSFVVTLFTPSFLFSFLLCAPGTIFMLNSLDALKRCSKTDLYTLFDVAVSAQGLSANCRTHLAASTSGDYKVVEIVGNVEGELGLIMEKGKGLLNRQGAVADFLCSEDQGR